VIDLRRLALLRELHFRGTISAVAAAMDYSPSSVSQQLSQLEREVGTTLLVKSGRRVRLTPAAETLVEHTHELLARMDALEAALAASGAEVAGTVRLAVFQSSALSIVPRALTLFAERHPLLRVEITQREPESALAAVWAREFDLVIAEQYPGHSAPRIPELDREPLCSDELRLGAMDAAITSISTARDASWVMEPRGTASRHWAEQLCRVAGFEPDVRFETADLQAHILLVESHHAVALLPDLIWAGERPSVRLVQLPGGPRREVFTSARLGPPGLAGSGGGGAGAAGSIGTTIAACRAILDDAVDALQLS
jgi:DNA-binding transcriptional LysR family regulator